MTEISLKLSVSKGQAEAVSQFRQTLEVEPHAAFYPFLKLSCCAMFSEKNGVLYIVIIS